MRTSEFILRKKNSKIDVSFRYRVVFFRVFFLFRYSVQKLLSTQVNASGNLKNFAEFLLIQFKLRKKSIVIIYFYSIES